jgi:hypothetical protein
LNKKKDNSRNGGDGKEEDDYYTGEHLFESLADVFDSGIFPDLERKVVKWFIVHMYEYHPQFRMDFVAWIKKCISQKQ